MAKTKKANDQCFGFLRTVFNSIKKRAEQNQLAHFISHRYFGLRYEYLIKDQVTAFSSRQIPLG